MKGREREGRGGGRKEMESKMFHQIVQYWFANKKQPSPRCAPKHITMLAQFLFVFCFVLFFFFPVLLLPPPTFGRYLVLLPGFDSEREREREREREFVTKEY